MNRARDIMASDHPMEVRAILLRDYALQRLLEDPSQILRVNPLADTVQVHQGLLSLNNVMDAFALILGQQLLVEQGDWKITSAPDGRMVLSLKGDEPQHMLAQYGELQKLHAMLGEIFKDSV